MRAISLYIESPSYMILRSFKGKYKQEFGCNQGFQYTRALQNHQLLLKFLLNVSFLMIKFKMSDKYLLNVEKIQHNV